VFSLRVFVFFTVVGFFGLLFSFLNNYFSSLNTSFHSNPADGEGWGEQQEEYFLFFFLPFKTIRTPLKQI